MKEESANPDQLFVWCFVEQLVKCLIGRSELRGVKNALLAVCPRG